MVGRIVVIIPALDYGSIEQVGEGLTTKKGNPSPNLLEMLAIRRTREICLRKNLKDFVILTDMESLKNLIDIPEAKYLEPGRLQLASLFLQRIINRARYVRRSARKSINRPPPDRIQTEIYHLFNSEKTEFRLSESALWNRIQSQIIAAKGTGQERLG